MSEEKWKRLSVVSLKFIEQFGELEWFEEQPSGAKSPIWFCSLYGATKVAP
jgi:hypothetical protein